MTADDQGEWEELVQECGPGNRHSDGTPMFTIPVREGRADAILAKDVECKRLREEIVVRRVVADRAFEESIRLREAVEWACGRLTQPDENGLRRRAGMEGK